MTPQPDDLAGARAAVAAIGPRFVRLVRDASHEGPVLGEWGIGEIACHVSHVIRFDTDALAGRSLPFAEPKPDAVAALNDAELAADTERDQGVLAGRIEDQLGEFLDISGSPAGDEVAWLGGIRIPASAAACHLVEELLVHGFDIARATNADWTIAPHHAALAILGAARPIINAGDPMAFVDPDRGRGFRARVDGRLRGYERLTLVFDDGLTVEGETSEPVDAHVSADPACMLLLLLGRVSAPRALLTGKVTVWGRRLWRLPRVLRVLAPP